MDSYLKDKADFSKIQRVLVIKLQHLGDVLLTTPVFSTLKQQYPHLEIDALIYADTATMLEENPDIDQLFSIDRAWKKQTWRKITHEYSLFRALKDRDYQLIIGLTDRMRAAWLTRLLKPAYSVAQKYPHKRGKFWLNSFSHLYNQTATPRHTVETHLDALRRLGVYPQNPQKHLRIFVNAEADKKIQSLLAAHNLESKQYVVIHPTSRWMFKAWNVYGFAEVLRILNTYNIATVVVSGPDANERSYTQRILQQQPATLDLSGQLTLQELSGLIAHASCFLGLDSVAMHIAAAVSTPCVALFGPSNDKIWHPWQVPHRMLTSDFTCRPCNQDGCGSGKISDCLQSIRATDVADAVLELMQEA